MSVGDWRSKPPLMWIGRTGKKQKGTQLKRGKGRKDVPRKGQWKKAAAPGVNKGSMRVVGTHFGVNE